MEIENFEIEIKPQFQESLYAIIEYIRQSSYQNAERFKKEIINLLFKIRERPYFYPIQHKISTQKEYRYAQFKKNYHVFFRIEGEKIFILDIFHVRRSLLFIKNLDKI